MDKPRHDSSYLHILKYTGLFGGVQGLNILVGIVRNKLVAMILGPNGMGLVSLFNSTVKLVSDSTSLGIPMSAVKNVSQAYDQGDAEGLDRTIRTIRLWSLVTGVIGMLLCIALSPLLNLWTFTWGNHTLHFIALSPVVALVALTGGETAILKGTRQLRGLAAMSVYNVLLALFISVPIYYFFGQSGIVPSLTLLALAQCLITVAFSFRRYPLRLSFSKDLFREGRGLVTLGVAFVVAGILGSGSEFVVRTFLNRAGDLSEVGLYNAGFMMTMTYSGIVFSAMETDYFPRLSGFRSLGAEFNKTVNHQMEVSLLLSSPILVAFTVSLPVLLPLLFSTQFLPAEGMMRFAILAMYLRAMNLPMEYIALSRGDSKGYLFLEAVYDVAFPLFVVLGYHWWGLTGTGIGLLAAGAVNFIVDIVYTRWRYGYSLSTEMWRYVIIQLPLGIVVLITGFLLSGPAYWVVGALVFVSSAAISLHIFHQKTHLWQAMRRRMRIGKKRKGDSAVEQ